MWELEQAIIVCQWLEKKLATIGFHCALAGGVLIKGSSEKDLDIVIYPHSKGHADQIGNSECFEKLKEWLKADSSNSCAGTSQTRDNKDVRWIESKGKRIDFFFLS